MHSSFVRLENIANFPFLNFFFQNQEQFVQRIEILNRPETIYKLQNQNSGSDRFSRFIKSAQYPGVCVTKHADFLVTDSHVLLQHPVHTTQQSAILIQEYSR